MGYFDFLDEPKKRQENNKIKFLIPSDLPEDPGVGEKLKFLTPEDLPPDETDKETGVDTTGYEVAKKRTRDFIHGVDRPFIKEFSGGASAGGAVERASGLAGIPGGAVGHDSSFEDIYTSAGANPGDWLKDITALAKSQLRPVDKRTADLFIATMGVVGQMGPEAEAKFYADLVNSMREKDAEINRQKQYEAALGIPEMKQAEADMLAEQRRGSSDREQLKVMYSRLNQLPEMRLNGSVIAFVLVSLLVGAKAAAAIFLRKSERGTLKAEIDSMIQTIKSNDDRARMAQEEYSRAKRDVAQRRWQGYSAAAHEQAARDLQTQRDTAAKERAGMRGGVDKEMRDARLDLMRERLAKMKRQVEEDKASGKLPKQVEKQLKDIEHAYVMQMSRVGELERILGKMGLGMSDTITLENGTQVTREDILRQWFKEFNVQVEIHTAWATARKNAGLPPILPEVQNAGTAPE